ncbi:hypothetical protein BD413DRAFT_593107 [Trametes elegans]|nr:hypothetical protein BD413DRAFT_593107 [Trametes elegans]
MDLYQHEALQSSATIKPSAAACSRYSPRLLACPSTLTCTYLQFCGKPPTSTPYTFLRLYIVVHGVVAAAAVETRGRRAQVLKLLGGRRRRRRRTTGSSSSSGSGRTENKRLGTRGGSCGTAEAAAATKGSGKQASAPTTPHHEPRTLRRRRLGCGTLRTRPHIPRRQSRWIRGRNLPAAPSATVRIPET